MRLLHFSAQKSAVYRGNFAPGILCSDIGFEDCFARHLQTTTKAAAPNLFFPIIALQR
jgi:hypothetical protein